MYQHCNSTPEVKSTINEIDIDNQQIEIETGSVMNQRVAKPTRESYERGNITFIICRFDHHNKQPSLIQPMHYNIMKTNKFEHISQMKTQSKQSKLRHNIRAVWHEALQTIKTDVQAPIPIKLEHLTFTIFSRVLSTYKKKLKMGYTWSRKRWWPGCWSCV